MTADSIVCLRGVTFTYAAESPAPRELFAGFDMSVARGERLTVLGASGAGKSTLGRLLAGMLTPSAGVRETPLNRPSDVVYVDQHALHSVFPWQSVDRNLTYPLERLGWSRGDRKSRVERLVETFWLPELRTAYPRALSGGELQRLAIARAIAWRPALLILDEAFAALDVATRATIISGLEELVDESGTTLISITHNISDAMRIGTRSVVLGRRPVAILADLGRDASTEAGGLERTILEAIHAGHL